METKHVFIPLVVGVLALGLGMGGGIYYQKEWAGIAGNTDQNAPAVIKTLSSKVIPSIAAYGKVSNITTNSITVIQDGEEVVFPVSIDAKIYATISTTTAATVTVPSKTTSSVSQVTLADVKVGDTVSLNFRVLADGQLEAFSIIILPASVN